MLQREKPRHVIAVFQQVVASLWTDSILKARFYFSVQTFLSAIGLTLFTYSELLVFPSISVPRALNFCFSSLHYFLLCFLKKQ